MRLYCIKCNRPLVNKKEKCVFCFNAWIKDISLRLQMFDEIISLATQPELEDMKERLERHLLEQPQEVEQ